MKAFLKNYNQAPRKVRLIADLVRGKSVPQAQIALTFLPKKSSPVISGLLASAVANAGQAGYAAEDLFVKTITVDKGMVLKRTRPFKQGRAGRLHHIMSHIALELGVNPGAVPQLVEKKDVAEKPAAKKPVAKKVAKKVATKTSTSKKSASALRSGEKK